MQTSQDQSVPAEATMLCACGGTIHLFPGDKGDYCDRCGPWCNAQTRPDDWRRMEARWRRKYFSVRAPVSVHTHTAATQPNAKAVRQP